MKKTTVLLITALMQVSAASGVFAAEKELDYQPDINTDARYCEFYVNAFGLGHRWTYHASGYSFLETFVSVDLASLEARQGGKVLNVGSFVKFKETTSSGESSVKEAFEFGYPVRGEPGYYRVEVQSDSASMGYTTERTFKQIAYFIDVKRSNGKIDRLWLKNIDKDFTLNEIVKGYPMSKPYNDVTVTVTYVEGNSPIYLQKASL